MRPNYIADPERPCYCGESCEETGKRWNSNVLCRVCQEHTKHEHCDEEHHCIVNGVCDCNACIVCGELAEDGKYCSDECEAKDVAPPKFTPTDMVNGIKSMLGFRR